MRIKQTLRSEMPIMKRCEAESTSGDEDAAPAPASSPFEMAGNVSAAAVPAELRLRLDSGDHPGAALASSSLTFGGGGSTRTASPHAVARTSRGRALVFPARLRDAVLIDPPKPASACGKLKNSVSRSSVTSMDSLPLPKEELAEFPVQEFGVGDIVWAKCRRDLSVWPAMVIEPKQRAPAGAICVMLFGCSRQRIEREYAWVKRGGLFPFVEYLERFQGQTQLHKNKLSDLRMAIEEAYFAEHGFVGAQVGTEQHAG